ncbi:hypothetical protein SFRURICE_005945 [Spodoptera frugiperda]|nr:hypothetical protein SFRURICE_005945 [Spodoptera frugiperda]
MFVLPPIPALFTKISIFPKRFTVSSIILLASSSLETSAAMIKGLPHFFATLFSFSWFLPTKATLAPSSANLMPIAAPMPELAPVTITTLSWKLMMLTLFSFSWFLPTNTTLAPSSANLMAVAAPMPELAPVTITTLSWKLMVENYCDVLTGPGLITLTRTPCGASSSATALVK